MQVLHGDIVDVLLQELNLGRYVGADLILVASGIQVAGQRITRLVTRLVQDGQVCPRCRVRLVQLYRADVCLQCIHRLVLLLIQHSENTRQHCLKTHGNTV